MIYPWGRLLHPMTDSKALNSSSILEVAAAGWSSSTQNLASLTRQCSNRTASWYWHFCEIHLFSYLNICLASSGFYGFHQWWLLERWLWWWFTFERNVYRLMTGASAKSTPCSCTWLAQCQPKVISSQLKSLYRVWRSIGFVGGYYGTRSRSIKFLAAIWCFTAFFFINIYSGILTSRYSAHYQYQEIKSLEDLANNPQYQLATLRESVWAIDFKVHWFHFKNFQDIKGVFNIESYKWRSGRNRWKIPQVPRMFRC